MNFDYSEIFLAISTDKIRVLTDFYSKFLQKQPDVHRPDIYTEFRLEKLRLAIFKPKPEREAEFRNLGSGMSLCLQVSDLNSAIATLVELGYPPPGEIIEASHGKEIYGYDPAGNRIILYQPK